MGKKERIVIEVKPEEKHFFELEAVFQGKTMKQMLLDAVCVSQRDRLTKRPELPSGVKKMLLAAEKEWQARKKLDGPAMSELTKFFSFFAERIRGAVWKWSDVNLASWQKYCDKNDWPEGGQCVFSLDGEGWTVETVYKKYDLTLCFETSLVNNLIYITNDGFGKFDVKKLLEEYEKVRG